MSTKEHGKMLKRLHILEDSRLLPKKQTIGKLKDKKKNHEERVSEAVE